MKFEELDREYPNGFVDAELIGCSIDYQNRSALLQLNLRGNLPDGESRDEYRRAVLSLDELYYFAIEPPDADHLWYPRQAIQVDGFAEDAAQFPLFEQLNPKLSKTAFCCRLYVHDWNSFIHIAASNAQFSWSENGAAGDSITSAM